MKCSGCSQGYTGQHTHLLLRGTASIISCFREELPYRALTRVTEKRLLGEGVIEKNQERGLTFRTEGQLSPDVGGVLHPLTWGHINTRS